LEEQMTNFVKYLNRFNENEKFTLCFIVNQYAPNEFGKVHKGLLPFLNTKVIVAALELAGRANIPATYTRFAKKALARIPEAIDPEAGKGSVSFIMPLNAAKVYRHFGSNPERGKPLSFLPKVRVTVGKRWSLPKKAYVDDTDVLVSPCVTLKLISGGPKKNIWNVTVLAKCRYAVEIWLLENCS
jgi:hypothetical protein